MSYEVGDKFILEVTEIIPGESEGYWIEDLKCSVKKEALDELPQLVKGVDVACYNKGMEDAWEIVKAVCYMNSADVIKCFGIDSASIMSILETFTPEQVKAKLEEFEKRIQVGGKVKKGVCPECGNKVNEKQKCCSNCGQALDWEPAKMYDFIARQSAGRYNIELPEEVIAIDVNAEAKELVVREGIGTFCPNCGKEYLSTVDGYCANCGQKVKWGD